MIKSRHRVGEGPRRGENEEIEAGTGI